jgi:hypothetical protein
MTEFATEDLSYYSDSPAEPTAVGDGFVARSRWWPVPFVIPMIICGASLLAGGIPQLTDVGFLVLVIACVAGLIGELIQFPRRFGIGGIVLYGGVLVWIGHDYLTNWWGYDFTHNAEMPAYVVAKAAFWNAVIVFTMVCGLLIRQGRWLVRLAQKLPEPVTTDVYWYLIVIMFVIGMSPYFLFTSESGFISVLKAAFSPWMGSGVHWSEGRTGSINYSWGAYIAQILEVGQTGSILAAMYAILLTRSLGRRAFCWADWLYQVCCAYQTDRRGELLFMFLPIIAIYFIKYYVQAAETGRKHSVLAYVIVPVIGFVMLYLIQVQGQYRGVEGGLANIGNESVDLSASRGNTMFTESLLGFSVIGETREPLDAPNLVYQIVRPIPQKAFDFIIGPIPRAIWTTKPVDPAWAWYNRLRNGDDSGDGTTGGTVASGLAGHWYIRFGPIGVIEGGFLAGWLMGIAERIFRESNGRPIQILLGLGVSTWLFRTYRDFTFPELYGLLIGIGAFCLAFIAIRPFTPSRVDEVEPATV